MSTLRTQPGEMKPYGALPVPQMTPELIGLMKTGTVYSLAVVHYEGIPVPGPMVPYTLTPRLRHGDLTEIAPASAAAEVITMAAHTGTHIDALCHIGESQNAEGEPDAHGEVRLYGGARAADTVSFQGQTHMGIEQMPPIITRAVLLDIPAYKGVTVLPDAYPVTAADVQGAAAAQGVTIRPGTAVLVRTGFYQHLRDGNPAYSAAQAGLNVEAARWLLEQGMILAGSDTMGVEVMPPMDHGVHRLLLVHNGVTHLENLFLEELAHQRVYEFVLIITPLRLQGSTGSWVHPIAIA